MRIQIGDEVQHPRTGKQGTVVDVHTNPACLLRSLDIKWADGTEEEVEELEFGPIDDSVDEAE